MSGHCKDAIGVAIQGSDERLREHSIKFHGVESFCIFSGSFKRVQGRIQVPMYFAEICSSFRSEFFFISGDDSNDLIYLVLE